MKRIVLLSLLLFPIFLFAQYPTFSNKQRLGVQTTGDGLIYRGDLEIPNYIPSNINNAYFYLDTVRNTLKFYKGGWIQIYPPVPFDTTTLNVYLKISDTTAMLLPYFRDADTAQLNLINRFALKLNISDTSVMLSPYLRKADTISLSNRINLKFNTSDTTILSNRITTNANNIITINTKLDTKLDTIYVKFKDVVTRVLNKDTINIGSSLIDGYAINIISDSINIDTSILDIRYPDRDSTNELQSLTFGTTSGVITIPGDKVMNLDTLYNSVIDSVNNLIQDSIAAFTPLTEGYGINIIGDSINVDTTIIFTQSDTITLSNRIDLKLNTSDTISLSNRINTKLNASDTASLSNRINLKLDTIYAQYPTYLDTITNKETINIPKDLTEGFGINIIADSINIDSAVILTTQQKQIAYVKNQSGVTMYKGQAVYSAGSTGNNKLVELASSNTEQTSSKTFGVIESDSIPNGEHGYVITFGLLSGFNTNPLNEGSSVYLSSTPGQLTTSKPVAPLHLVTIGICIRQNQNNGSIFVKIQNGFELNEIHDVLITSPVDKASLYYSGGLWRDTTATLLVSDTLNMLLPYLRKADTSLLNLTNRFDSKLNLSDTANMLANYNTRINLKLNIADTTNMLFSYLRKADTSNLSYVNTYGNQDNINGNKTFNNVITIDSATVTGKLLVNTNISDAVKINTNTNSTNLELMNSGGSVFIKSSNKNMTLQTDTTALVYLKGDVNRVGILTMNPQQALQVVGTIRVDSLDNNLTPIKLVGGNASNDLTDVKLGTGLSISNDTLKIADNIINLGDTATLLRQDFLGINSNVLIWTQGNKKLLPYFTQVYRNGQLLKSDSQYTITSDSIVTLESGSYKLDDNITIIAIDNVVALAGSGGIISLQGDVSGSGTSTITTTIGNSKVLNSMLAGSISNDKLDVISAANKVSNSATTATSNNTNNAIVARDGSGNFTANTITASLSGNANTATTLATGRTISITGDLTYTSPSFNGSTNVTAVGTLANTTVTPNTYTAATLTVDSKGRITSASSNTIPTVNDGTLTLAVSGNGLTGSQSFTANQSTAATFTVTSNATNTNTVSTIVFRDGSGSFSANNISANNFLGNATSSTNATFAANITNYLDPTESFKFRSNSNNTGSRIITFPNGDVTVARTDAAQTFTGTQTFSNTIDGNINGNAATATLASTVTTNANLNGDITSVGNTTTIATGVIVNADINNSAAIAVSKLAASTISGITLGNNLNTLTINAPLTGTSYNGSSSISIGISAATTLAAGSMSAADKSKLDGIAAGATANTGTVTSVSGTGTVSGLTLTGTVSTTGNLTLGGTLSLTSGNVTTALGYTPYNSTNPNGYITSSSLSSYLPLTGGTLSGNLRLASSNGTQLNIDANDNNLESRITFSTIGSARSKIYTTSSVSSMTFESIAQASAKRGFRFISSTEGTQYLGLVQDPQGNVGIKSDATGNDVHPNTLYVNGTLGVSGAVTLSTTTTTPSTLLGKDGNNLVGTVTTVAQTGLMTRGVTTATTGSSVATFDVTHNLGIEPVSIIVTPNAIDGNTKIFYEIVGKTSTLFRVQAFNVADGSPATSKTVSVYWMAIK